MFTRERNDIIEMREKILFWVDNYRAEEFQIYYQDETWLNHNIAPNLICNYAEDGTVQYKAPSVKGERSIICHLG